MAKKYLSIDVLAAARERVSWAFDTFTKIYVSFSGGKDSSVMLHLVMDEALNREEEASKTAPSWRRICKTLLRNDYWCKGLSFTQTKSESYEKYLKVMKRRRQKWGL